MIYPVAPLPQQVVQCPKAHSRSTKSTYCLSTQVNSMPDFSNKQTNTSGTTGKTGVSFEQELPENENSSTGTRDFWGGHDKGSRGRWMTRHTSYVPQLDPVRQWPCPSLGQQAGRANGGPARKEPDSLEQRFLLGQAVGLALSPWGVPGWSG